MTPRVISQDLYASVVTVANANAAAYARVASGHQDVAGQWMGRSANLPETNAGAAVDAAAGQAQRQAVAHQNESDALNATANYHRRAADLGQQMNGQLDRLDQRAQRLLDGSQPNWHGTIRALANAMAQTLNSIYALHLWGPQERAGSVIEPLHQGIIRGLGGPPAGAAAPSPVGKGSPPASASPGPLQAVSMPAQAVPDTASASAAAPAAASQPDRPELVPTAVGVGVPVPAESGSGESANWEILPVSPPDDDDDGGDGGGGTIVSMPAGGGAGGRAGSDKPRESRRLGKSQDSCDLGKTGAEQAEAGKATAVAEPAATPLESTPAAAAPAAAVRKRPTRKPNQPKGQTP